LLSRLIEFDLPGILPATLLASAPLLLSLWWSRSLWQDRLGRPARAFLAVALLALGAGGILVSLKVGGGSNLHNLDAYLVLLLLVGSSLLLQGSPGDFASTVETKLPPFRQTALLVAVPPCCRRRRRQMAASRLRFRRSFAQAIAEKAQAASGEEAGSLHLAAAPADIRDDPGSASNRSTRRFPDGDGDVGNRAYLDRFHALLQQEAFGLIIDDHPGTRSRVAPTISGGE
jgi:hypothetical protein